MNSPDEIKKGLECCVDGNIVCAGNCTFDDDVKLSYPDCVKLLMTNALALIQQLQAENAEKAETIERLNTGVHKLIVKIQQLEAERDAMKEALGLMVYQYCVRGDKLDHLYMCAGETAFRVLGLEQYGDTRTLESWLFPECQDKEE